MLDFSFLPTNWVLVFVNCPWSHANAGPRTSPSVASFWTLSAVVPLFLSFLPRITLISRVTHLQQVVEKELSSIPVLWYLLHSPRQSSTFSFSHRWQITFTQLLICRCDSASLRSSLSQTTTLSSQKIGCLFFVQKLYVPLVPVPIYSLSLPSHLRS